MYVHSWDVFRLSTANLQTAPAAICSPLQMAIVGGPQMQNRYVGGYELVTYPDEISLLGLALYVSVVLHVYAVSSSLALSLPDV